MCKTTPTADGKNQFSAPTTSSFTSSSFFMDDAMVESNVFSFSGSASTSFSLKRKVEMSCDNSDNNRNGNRNSLVTMMKESVSDDIDRPEGEKGDAVMTDILMSSINLEDEDFMAIDLDSEDNENNSEKSNTTSSGFQMRTTIVHESMLFDPTRQQFEWRDEVSLFRQLKVTRLSTLWEE